MWIRVMRLVIGKECDLSNEPPIVRVLLGRPLEHDEQYVANCAASPEEWQAALARVQKLQEDLQISEFRVRPQYHKKTSVKLPPTAVTEQEGFKQTMERYAAGHRPQFEGSCWTVHHATR